MFFLCYNLSANEEWGFPLFNVILGGVFVEERIRNLLERPINDAGYILDEVFYGKDGSSNVLRLVIDKEDGYINIGDCVKINEVVNPILDKEDPISESYVLDVCSKEKGSDSNESSRI